MPSSRLRVEGALALIPDLEELLPFTDALIGTSHPDAEKRWARSGAYATLGMRVVDPARVAETVSTLDLVSDGRVEFGSGETSSGAELGGFGVERATKREQWAEGYGRPVTALAKAPNERLWP